MQELKVFYSPDGEHTKSYYFKSEADVVIAELEAKNEMMESELAALKEAQRWRKHSEELPEEGKYVLAFCPHLGVVEMARLHDDGEWRNSTWEYIEVSHWMPLPNPPEADK